MSCSIQKDRALILVPSLLIGVTRHQILLWVSFSSSSFFVVGGHVNDGRHFSPGSCLIFFFFIFLKCDTAHTGEKMNRTQPKKMWKE
jgi:hypothetical protein